MGVWFGVDCLWLLLLCVCDYGLWDGMDLFVWICGVLSSVGLFDDGEVWLQIFLCIVGWMFNFVLFWYCYDVVGMLCVVLVEVNNIFGQYYCYLLCVQDGGVIDVQIVLMCCKQLYVLFFCRVEGGYWFCFIEMVVIVLVCIDYYDYDGFLLYIVIGGWLQLFDVVYLCCVLLWQLLFVLQVIGCIYWQVLCLWVKGVLFFGCGVYDRIFLENF